ncbi:MAG TPA: MaoC/PaaZ C-terminal domain-containing protein, partial [Micromonosporaceae bacterium]
MNSNLRAVAGLARRNRPDRLPDTRLTMTGIGIDTDRLAAYDRVCGFRLTDAVPSTFPHVLAFPTAMRLMTSADFPFGAIGLVHIANRITQRRPLAVTEKINFQVYASDLRPHDRGQQFDVTATGTVDGDEVWRDVSTYLKRTGGSAGASRTEGQRLTPSAVWHVGREVGSAYASVSGDRNPIHTSRLGARLFGFPGPIAHGMWTAARCLAALEGQLPEAYEMEVVFKRPIRLPSDVSFAHDGGAIEVRGVRT